MKQFFTQGKNKIVWIGSNFQEWFGGVKAKPKKVKLFTKILPRSMNDQEILSEFKPQECSLDDVAYAMENSKKMLRNSYANIFYIKDQNGVLRAVYAYWDDDGWGVFAIPVGHPGRWFRGSQVFSRNSFETLDKTLRPSETLTLESRIKNLEDKLQAIAKILTNE